MPYSAADVRKRERILRMLLGAPVKAGKTVAAVNTAPRPVHVFNTDGQGALDPVVALDPENDFTADDITSVDSFERSLAWVKAHSSNVATCVFDNITTFAGRVEEQLRDDDTLKDGRQMWPAYDRAIMGVVNALLALPQHVIIIGHIQPGESNVPGGFDHMLGISGKAKTKIGAIIQDWVWLQVENMPDGAVKREFLLAPQGNWHKGVRSIQHTKKMDANVSEFIRLMNDPKTLAKIAAPRAAAPAANGAKPAPAPIKTPGGVRVLPVKS